MVSNLYIPVEIFFGEGATSKVGEVARRYGFKGIIITGRSSSKENGSLERVIDSLKRHGIEELLVYDRVEPNPLDRTVNEAADIVVKEKIDFIVGLGGGSALDVAKAVSIVSSNEGSVWDYVKYPEGARLVPFYNRPVICIPTTAGTGSEVDRYSVITNPIRKEKLVVSHSLNYPKVALIDPTNTRSMPPSLTAITGFDALTHALESLTNRAENFIAEEYSIKAVELIARWLPVAVEEPDNPKARRYMSYASMLAGIAIDHLGVALIHSLEHPVSAHYPRVAHGAGLAILAPHITKYNYKHNEEKYSLFAELMGYGAKAHKAVDALVELRDRLGLPTSLREVGVEYEKLDRLTEDVYMLSRHSFLINPKEPKDLEEIRKLYEEAYTGQL
jgi:alcohol dehydrogenase/1,3-propanediol dehydrogenase